jgi:O-antigen/teichoic acid export membrane protein
MSSPAERPLRSHRVKSALATGLVSRGVRFLTNLILARAIILQFGPGNWGVLALCWAVGDLVFIADLAIHELSLYEAAASTSRQGAQRALDQALILSILPAALGTLALLGCAAAASQGIVFRADYAGPTLAWLFLSAAAAYPILIVDKVYVGTLQGFGWIRELNLWALCTLLLDFGIVVAGLKAGLGVVAIQWARTGLAPIGLLLLLWTVRRLGLPLARPRPPNYQILRPMFRYAVSYNFNRGLGSAVASTNAPIAQFFVPAAALGAFGAADQWASKLRKFTDVAWESIYHRLVHCLRADASADEREAGRLQFLAVSLGINLLLVPAGVLLILAGPWLFRAWLDEKNAVLPLALLPGLVAAWTLNATCSPLTWVVMAMNRFRLSARIHIAAVVVNIVLTIVLTRIRGISGAVEAMVISSLLLAFALSVAACRLAATSWWRWLRSNSIPYVVAIGVLAWSHGSDSPRTRILAMSLSIGASVAVGLKARSFRLLGGILRKERA